MKYIDADKLIAEIDRQEIGCNTDGKHTAEYNTCRKILDIITSLQQEQPAKRGYKDCNGCKYNRILKDQIGWQFRGCFGGDYTGKPIAEIELCTLKQELPEVDLEKEFDDFLEKENAYVDDNGVISYYNGGSFNHTCDIYPIARHFYELARQKYEK